MTADQVQTNLISLAACKPGIDWSAGKDSEEIWSSTDDVAPSYIIWWCVKNAGQPGWRTIEETISVFQKLLEIACRYSPTFADSMMFHFSTLNVTSNFAGYAAGLYAEMEYSVAWEDRHKTALSKFRSEVLPIIKELKVS